MDRMRGTYDTTLVRIIHDVRSLVSILPVVQDDLVVRTNADKVITVWRVFDILHELCVSSD